MSSTLQVTRAIPYKTEPYEHQAQLVENTWNKAYYALFLEQGLGKTKIIIDSASKLFKENWISGVLVLSPNGLQENWSREVKEHAFVDTDCFPYYSNQRKSKWEDLKVFIDEPSSNLSWLCMNIEAIRTKKGFTIAQRFLMHHRTLLVVDESTVIKNPKAQQTKAALKLARNARFRRILSGTPITNNPVDLYSQCKFLSPKAIPYPTFTGFKSMFTIQQQMMMGNRQFNKIVGFRNLDRLKSDLQNFSSRLTKEECLDLPEKLYQSVIVPLSSKQRKIYDNLRELSIANLEAEEKDKGVVSTTSIISTLLRLQQVVSGFVRTDEGTDERIDKPDDDYRISTLKGILQGINGKVVIWCHFRHTVETLLSTLSQSFGSGSALSYYGEDTARERVDAVGAFQRDNGPRFLIVNAAGSRGITLHRASTAIYFERSYSLETRLQSEDRIHRIGQSRRCLYIDLITPDTIDQTILEKLKMKQDLSDKVLGDWRQLI